MTGQVEQGVVGTGRVLTFAVMEVGAMEGSRQRKRFQTDPGVQNSSGCYGRTDMGAVVGARARVRFFCLVPWNPHHDRGVIQLPSCEVAEQVQSSVQGLTHTPPGFWPAGDPRTLDWPDQSRVPGILGQGRWQMAACMRCFLRALSPLAIAAPTSPCPLCHAAIQAGGLGAENAFMPRRPQVHCGKLAVGQMLALCRGVGSGD